MIRVYHNSFFAMGSRFNAVFPSNDEEVCEHIFNSIQHEVLRIESKLSYFYPGSEVNKINKTACKSSVKLDDELFTILETCMNYSKKTFGAFDITLRPVIENIEQNDKGSACAGQSHLHQIELDRINKSVRFSSDKVKIDFGGFGKGYALGKIKLYLDNSPLENVFISFGESSIYGKGRHPHGDCWTVGIKDLFNTNGSLHLFDLSDSAISISSNYYLNDSGELHSKVNVINPLTGKPADGVSIAGVKSDSALEAEILSTAFLVMEDAQIQETINMLKRTEAVKIRYSGITPVKKFYNRT
jgi:thiamine biosynthesis lipoprotein